MSMQQEHHDSNYLVHCVQEFDGTISKLQLPGKCELDGTSSKLTNCTDFLKDVEEKEGGSFHQRVELSLNQ